MGSNWLLHITMVKEGTKSWYDNTSWYLPYTDEFSKRYSVCDAEFRYKITISVSFRWTFYWWNTIWKTLCQSNKNPWFIIYYFNGHSHWTNRRFLFMLKDASEMYQLYTSNELFLLLDFECNINIGNRKFNISASEQNRFRLM